MPATHAVVKRLALAEPLQRNLQHVFSWASSYLQLRESMAALSRSARLMRYLCCRSLCEIWLTIEESRLW